MRIQALVALILVSCLLQVHGFDADFAARHISQKINTKIDPKIRRALLNVLNKFENQEEGRSSNAVNGESSDTSEGEVYSSEKTETHSSAKAEPYSSAKAEPYSSAKAEPYSSARTESYSTTAEGDDSRALEGRSNEDDTEKRISEMVDVRFDSSSQPKNHSYEPMDEEELYSHLRGKLEEQEEKKNEVKVETLKLDESNGSVMQQIKDMLASLEGSSRTEEMRVISVPLTTQKSDEKVSSTESQDKPNLIRQGFSSNGVTVDVIQAPLLVSYDLKDDFGTPSVSLGTFNKNFADFMAKELKSEFNKLHAPLDLQNLISNEQLKNQNTTGIQESSDGVLQLQSLGLLNGGLNNSDINGGPFQLQSLGLVNTRGFDFGTPQVNPNLNLQNLVLRQQSNIQNSTENKASDFGALQLQKILNSGIVQSQGQLLQSGDARFPGASNLEINQLGQQNFGLGFREDLTNEALKQLQLQQTPRSNEALRSAIEKIQKSQTSAETARTQQPQKPQFQFQDFNAGFQPQTLSQPDGIRLALGQLLEPQLKGGFGLPTAPNAVLKSQGQLNLGLGQQRQFNLEGLQSQDNDIEQKLREIMRKKQELEAEKQQYLLELEKRKNLENQKQSPQQPTLNLPNIGTRFGGPSFNKEFEQNQKGLSNFGTLDGINIQKSYELSSPLSDQFNGFGFPGFFGSNAPLSFQPPPQYNEKQIVNKQNTVTEDASKKVTPLQNFPTPQFAPPVNTPAQFNQGSSNIVYSGFPNPISNDIYNEIPSESFRDVRRPQIFANNLQQHPRSAPFSDAQFNQQTPVHRFDIPQNNFGFGQPNFILNAFPNFAGFR